MGGQVFSRGPRAPRQPLRSLALSNPLALRRGRRRALTSQAGHGVDPFEELPGAQLPAVVGVSGKDDLAHVHLRARHVARSNQAPSPAAGARACRGSGEVSRALCMPVFARPTLGECVVRRALVGVESKPDSEAPQDSEFRRGEDAPPFPRPGSREEARGWLRVEFRLPFIEDCQVLQNDLSNCKRHKDSIAYSRSPEVRYLAKRRIPL